MNRVLLLLLICAALAAQAAEPEAGSEAARLEMIRRIQSRAQSIGLADDYRASMIERHIFNITQTDRYLMIQLDDGSLWKLATASRATTAAWVTMQKIVVLPNPEGAENYKFTLVSGSARAPGTADAEFLGLP